MPLRDGTSVMLWEHSVGLFHPDLGSLHLPAGMRDTVLQLARGEGAADTSALGAFVTAEAAAPSSARLAACDELYGGWLAELRRAHAARLERTIAMQARMTVTAPPGASRATLPFSTLRRALAVEASGARRVFVDDDVDGLALLLAESCEVTADVDELSRAFIAAESKQVRFGVPEVGSCDAAVVTVGDPLQSHRALERSAAALRPGGRVFARLRAPYDGPFEAMAQAAGFLLCDQIREIDYRVLPGPFVLDGAGDLLVLERPAEPRLGPAPAAAESLRARPYWGLDFDALAPERCGDDALERWLDVLAARAPRPEVSRSVTRAGDRELACWYDAEGFGLTAELHRADGHIMVSQVPYEAALEYVVESSVIHVLGDSLTRLRPFKSGHYMGQSIVA